MPNKLIDMSLGISEQAYAVLQGLRRLQIEVPDGVGVQTRAWYNGRERGIALSLYQYSGKTIQESHNDQLNITFGECRNSEQIFVDHWVGYTGFSPPTVENFTEEAYNNRQYFPYMDIVGVTEKIKEMVDEFCGVAV